MCVGCEAWLWHAAKHLRKIAKAISLEGADELKDGAIAKRLRKIAKAISLEGAGELKDGAIAKQISLSVNAG
ncbi:hypothetical protein, partial [Paenibacillus sp. NPDC058174]|uniref:hypothetical protein n=1 Tax=Paenibacillus sp. NPDC058174 TaxID=3346366 RepID=UPI0036DB3796